MKRNDRERNDRERDDRERDDSHGKPALEFRVGPNRG